MRLGAGDVLGIEALVDIDRGVDVAHDLSRAAGKAAIPQRPGCVGLVHRETRVMRWGPAILALWLFAAPAPADDSAPRLGEFIPAAPPVSAPAISFADL